MMGSARFVSFREPPAAGTGRGSNKEKTSTLDKKTYAFALGITGLKSCSAVIITSKEGAILAFLPTESRDIDKFSRPTEYVMTTIENFYNKNRGCFPPASTKAFCVGHLYGGSLFTQMEAVKFLYNKFGLVATLKYHKKQPDPSTPGNGTVVVTRGARVFHNEKELQEE